MNTKPTKNTMSTMSNTEIELSTTVDLEEQLVETPKSTLPKSTPPKIFYTVFEVLTEVNSKVKKEDKLAVLRANDTKALRYVLQASYDDNVQCILPDGEPPFTPNRQAELLSLNAVASEIPKLFKYGPMGKEPISKVEFFFMDLLSKVQKEEAMILVRMKDKLLQQMFRKITKPVVREFLSDAVEIK